MFEKTQYMKERSKITIEMPHFKFGSDTVNMHF